MPKLSVIIPVYNQWALTVRCLRSLAEHTGCGDFELIVVDNGSTDATLESLESAGSLFASYTCIRSEQRQSFAQGCNAGARQAQGDVLFFLNNDTQAMPDWDLPLLTVFQRQTWGALAPLLVFEPDFFGVTRVQHLGVGFAPVPEHLYAHFPAEYPLVSRPRALQALSAAAVLIAAPLFAACGGFCEDYCNGYEDLELCARIRAKALPMACVPQSMFYHDEGQSEGRFAANQANTRLYFERWGTQTRTDVPDQYVGDGLALFLNPWLEIRPTLLAERAAALATQCAAVAAESPVGNSAQAYSQYAFDLVLANPLWEQGYTIAQPALEARGNAAEQLAFACLHNRFFPRLENFPLLRKLAQQARQETLFQSIQQQEQSLNALYADVDTMRLRMRSILDILAQKSTGHSQSALQAALGQWRSQSPYQKHLVQSALRS